MSDIRLYGFPVSPNVRAARMAFHEKGVAVEFREIGLDHLPSLEYGAINPFRKMPALVHGGVRLYETPALMTYADGIGSGPSLEPANAVPRAKMWQFVGVAQNYLYPVGCMQLYFQNVLAGLFGMDPDAAIADSAVAPTTMHLDVLETALDGGISLASASATRTSIAVQWSIMWRAPATDARLSMPGRRLARGSTPCAPETASRRPLRQC